MADEFLAGYKVSFTIDGGSEMSLAADQLALVYGAAQLPKPVFGSAAQRAIAGQKSGTFTASGHGEADAQPVLAGLRDAAGGAPVAVVITYGGTGDNAPDLGSDEFDLIVGEVGVQAAADGQLEWSLAGTIDGAVTYTAPA